MQQQENPLAQKSRRGLNRVLHATGYSLSGLRMAMHETAFRQEAILAALLCPLAPWLASNVVEFLLLIFSVVLVLVVELLNTAVESAIDRIGPQYHELSKRAKDLGSAAVLLSLLLCVTTWAAIAASRFLP